MSLASVHAEWRLCVAGMSGIDGRSGVDYSSGVDGTSGFHGRSGIDGRRVKSNDLRPSPSKSTEPFGPNCLLVMNMSQKFEHLISASKASLLQLALHSYALKTLLLSLWLSASKHSFDDC